MYDFGFRGKVASNVFRRIAAAVFAEALENLQNLTLLIPEIQRSYTDR
jgi:hypothetical protein